MIYQRFQLNLNLFESQSEEEEATSEQLDDLQKQLDDLENILSTKLNTSLNQPTTNQFLTIKTLEKEIKDFEDASKEHKIIQTLQKQNKKLSAIEKQLQDSITNKKNSSENLISETFCVKCKTKRKIIHPEKTVMKNGRIAVKGICTVCSCQVFRFVKMKKK